MDDINIVNPLNEIKDIASHGGVFKCKGCYLALKRMNYCNNTSIILVIWQSARDGTNQSLTPFLDAGQTKYK